MPYFDITRPAALRPCGADDGLITTLRHNLGRVCTVHTQSEASPLGITGVLSEIDYRSCKLISLSGDAAPRRSDCENMRRIHTIPLDKITCVDTVQY